MSRRYLIATGILLGIFAGALLHGSAFAQRGGQYTLQCNPSVKIVGPFIHLGELVRLQPPSKEIEAKLASIRVGKAAPPSETKDIYLSRIRILLKRHKLLDRMASIQGPRVIRVTTAHKDITRLKLREAVAAFLNTKLAPQQLEWELQVLRAPDTIAVPAAAHAVEVAPQGRFRGRGYQQFDVRFTVGGELMQSARVATTIRTYQNVAVAVAQIRARTTLSGEQIELQRRETTSLVQADVLTEIPDAAFRARVHVRKGDVLTLGKVERIPLISRGEKIEIRIVAGAVQVVSDAIAQQAGGLNDNIRVWHGPTRRSLQGQVVGKSQVKVIL